MTALNCLLVDGLYRQLQTACNRNSKACELIGCLRLGHIGDRWKGVHKWVESPAPNQGSYERQILRPHPFGHRTPTSTPLSEHRLFKLHNISWFCTFTNHSVVSVLSHQRRCVLGIIDHPPTLVSITLIEGSPPPLLHRKMVLSGKSERSYVCRPCAKPGISLESIATMWNTPYMIHIHVPNNLCDIDLSDNPPDYFVDFPYCFAYHNRYR